MQPRQQPERGERAPIVNLRQLHAQSPDVDGKLAEQFFPAEFVNHSERFLRFAQGKDRHQDAAAAFERVIDRRGQPPLLRLASEIFRQRTVAARRFNDQNIDAAFRKRGAPRDRLIVEVHIASVENRAALGTENNAGRTQDMARLHELDRDPAFVVRPRPFTAERERLAHRARAPLIRRAVGLAMSEERIHHHAELLALPRHDVDGIMQKRASDFRGRFRHEDPGGGLTPHQDGQGADVIEMRVRNHDRIERAPAKRLEVWQGILALLLRMHAAIEHKPLPCGFEVITVGANLSAPGEIDEFQPGEDDCFRLTRAIANYSNCSKIRIQFPNRIFLICSSSNPRSISLRVTFRASE